MATIEHINVTMAAKIKTGVGWKNFWVEKYYQGYMCVCVYLLMLILSTITVSCKKSRFYRSNASKWHLKLTPIQNIWKRVRIKGHEKKGFLGIEDRYWQSTLPATAGLVYCWLVVLVTYCWCFMEYYCNNLAVNLCLKPTFFVYGKVT